MASKEMVVHLTGSIEDFFGQKMGQKDVAYM